MEAQVAAICGVYPEELIVVAIVRNLARTAAPNPRPGRTDPGSANQRMEPRI